MERSINDAIYEDSIADFSGELGSNRPSSIEIMRPSLDSLNSSSWRNDNEDSISLSLNDDLQSRSGSVAFSRRSFESSSIFTSSFRQSIDDSLPSLGLNKLSIQKVSPLGPNSIYELVADVDSKRTKSSSLSPNLSRTRAKINISSPTSQDIPTVQLSKVERPPKEKFKGYLTDIASEYEKYNSNKQLTPSTLKSLITEDRSLLTTDDVHELDDVPQIFFSEEFNLDDPRVFKQVTEGNSLDNLNDALQENLSTHLDTIEIHLVNEISKSSNSFFDALNDLNDINEKNKKTIKLIDDLKSQTQLLEKRKIQVNLNKLKLEQKRENVSKLEQALLQTNTIIQESKYAKNLFLKGEYENCINKIDEIELLIKGEFERPKWKFPLQDLSNLPALSSIKEELNSLRSQTGKSYSKIFVGFMLNDLRQHYEEIDYLTTLNRLSDGTNYQREIKDDFRNQLQEYVIGLSRSGEITAAFKSYEENFINDMKNIVRIFLPNEESISAESAKDSSSAVSSTVNKPSGKSLSTLIKSLTPREFEDMLAKIYSTVSEGLRRLTVHQKLLLDLALSNIEDTQGDLIMKLDIRDGINKTVEIIQIRMGKIIAVRKDLNANLRGDYFLRMFYINSIFLNECESITGLNFKFLPDVISSQIKQFNANFQSTNIKRVSHSIDTEEWKPLIVSRSLQLIVNDIIDNKDLDEGRPWKKELFQLRDDKKTDAPQEEASHKRSIVVGDKTFVANNSLLVLITIIKDILVLSSNFHHLATLYESNILELLKHYNNRVMQSLRKPDGSLNREKNLSVVGESLDCLAEVIHYIRIDFDNLELDDTYDKLLMSYASSKGKIDSINTIPE